MQTIRHLTAALGLAVLPFAVLGCVSPRPSPDLAGRFERATGIAGSVSFQTHGEPLDVENSNDETLRLDEAIRRSLAHSPAIQAAIARVRAAEADASQARLLPNPVLSVVFKFPEGGGSPNIEAGLAADLISLLRRPRQVSAVDARLRAAAAEAVTELLDVLAEVQQHYAAVQALDQLVGVLEERLNSVDRLLDIARDRLKTVGRPLDVLTLEAQRIEVEAELAEQQLERTEERLALTRMIGEPSSQAGWSLTPWEAEERPVSSDVDWVALALKNRPEVQARQFELAALAAEAKLAGFAPFDGTELGLDAERDDGDWEVGPGVSVPLPIFDFGQARRNRARAAVIEARHHLTLARRTAVEETRRAYAAFAASRTNLARVRDRLIPSLQKRFDQAESQFRAGFADITTLLLAEEELRAGRTRLVALQRRNTEALVRLQRAAGGPGLLPPLSPTTQPTTTTTSTTTRPAGQTGGTK